MDPRHDPDFMKILAEEKNITSFLDGLFGFLFRCTDFYIDSSTGSQNLGFPKGVAEELLFYTYRKWQNMKTINERSTQVDIAVPHSSILDAGGTHLSIAADLDDKRSIMSNSSNTTFVNSNSVTSTADCYNGASYEHYRWSQTINDLDVVVVVPQTIQSSKHLRVFLNADIVEVAVVQPTAHNKNVNEWKVIVRGELSHKIKNSESFWCLEPGKWVNMHLQKTEERWWQALLKNEPRLQMSKIDCTKNFEDLGEREQMKVEELIYQQRCKFLDTKTSSMASMRYGSREASLERQDPRDHRSRSTLMSRSPSRLKSNSNSPSRASSRTRYPAP